MTLSLLPLSYCTNVHPGRTVAEIDGGLDRYTVRAAASLAEPLAAGLWLADSVVRELEAQAETRRSFVDGLARRRLVCYTLNAFPFGDFHGTRVKENVYRPSWADPRRLAYTLSAANVLADLLCDGVEGSISTVPLGFPGLDPMPDFAETCADRLIDASVALDRLRAERGRLVRLAVEPEPCCWLDTTPTTIDFFTKTLWPRAAERRALDAAQTHIGLCFDVCHQAVAFEDPAHSIAAIDGAGLRINKVHITCAIEVEDPARNVDARRALAEYVEPRYLHQTKARLADGRIISAIDLERGLALDPPPEFRDAAAWRVHFHVPVDAEGLGPLKTTRPELRPALAAVRDLSYAPHLEVETYTWEVLPNRPAVDLADGLARELTATRALLDGLSR